tara:strand:+ start:4475 stop:5257 length:783 start_codon:yes stop_codon:yes gene_type:complete
MIGVFDSGFGGLSIFRAIEREQPSKTNLIYLGDSQRVPYGNRSDEIVFSWCREALDWLFGQGCEHIVLACHTASNVALEKLKAHYGKRGSQISGVTIPIVNEVCRVAKARVGVLGTRATCRSRRFELEINKLRNDLQVFHNPAPMLVPLVEEGFQSSPECKRFIRRYLGPLKQKKIDTLILGCTHFPLLYDLFVAKSGHRIRVLESSSIVAKSIPIIEGENQSGIRKIYTTDDPELFEGLGAQFLGRKFEAKKVVISHST